MDLLPWANLILPEAARTRDFGARLQRDTYTFTVRFKLQTAQWFILVAVIYTCWI